MSRTTVTLVALTAALALPGLSSAADRSGGAAAWDTQHLPSPAPGYLPRFEPTRQPIVVVRSVDGGFSWGDASIGLAVGIGVALSASGAVVVARRSPRSA